MIHLKSFYGKDWRIGDSYIGLNKNLGFYSRYFFHSDFDKEIDADFCVSIIYDISRIDKLMLNEPYDDSYEMKGVVPLLKYYIYKDLRYKTSKTLDKLFRYYLYDLYEVALANLSTYFTPIQKMEKVDSIRDKFYEGKIFKVNWSGPNLLVYYKNVEEPLLFLKIPSCQYGIFNPEVVKVLNKTLKRIERDLLGPASKLEEFLEKLKEVFKK